MDEARVVSLRGVVVLLSVCVFATASGRAIGAQVIRGAVVLPDSVTPVAGVIVTATDDRGATAGRALTGARGDFVLQLPTEGRYALRVLRIGYRPAPGPTVTVGAAATEHVRIVYAAAPVMLSGMNVRERETCRVSADTGLMVTRVWDEARKAMLSSQLSADGAPLVADWIEYDRRLDAAARTILEQRVRSARNPTTHAFRSVSGTVLDSAGYVVVDTGGTTYYAPDAEVLLSSQFLAGHCFRLEAERAAAGGGALIGVAFQPSRDRRDKRDIQGTLWVDLASSELRTLEFTYTNLPSAAAIAGGRVEFLRLADGNWLVSRWSLRMPRLGVSPTTGEGLRRVVVSGTQTVLRGVQVSGGEVTRVTRGDSLVYAANGPALAAQVVARDTVLPAIGAALALEGTDYAATADASGRIRLSPVLAGRYHARVSTPLMDSLGIPPVVRDVEVREDAHVDSLMLPAASDALRAVCPRDSAGDGQGMLRGRVRDERAAALPHAAVTVTWTSDAERTIGALTDADGYWRVCGVPRATALSVQVVADSGSDTRKARLGSAEPLGSIDLVVRRDASTSGPSALRRAVLELVVTTINGVALPDATLEVQTPGGQSRTVVSGPAGRALVPDIAPGMLTVRAKRIGFKPGQLAVTVEPGRNTVPIILSDVSMPTLDTVRVIGGRRATGRLDEFETRRLNHEATVSITRADIEKRNPVDIWQLLRGIPSIEIRDMDTMMVAISSRTQRAGLLNDKPCYLTVMVDGLIKTATPGNDAYDLRDLPVPVEVYGVEVFAGAATMPLQYGGVGTGKMCGMIALWTR